MRGTWADSLGSRASRQGVLEGSGEAWHQAVRGCLEVGGQPEEPQSDLGCCRWHLKWSEERASSTWAMVLPTPPQGDAPGSRPSQQKSPSQGTGCQDWEHAGGFGSPQASHTMPALLCLEREVEAPMLAGASWPSTASSGPFTAHCPGHGRFCSSKGTLVSGSVQCPGGWPSSACTDLGLTRESQVVDTDSGSTLEP